jgi:hypothetical protein
VLGTALSVGPATSVTTSNSAAAAAALASAPAPARMHVPKVLPDANDKKYGKIVAVGEGNADLILTGSRAKRKEYLSIVS